jgi:[acyl-carrier-protein] S-malonyltransferase
MGRELADAFPRARHLFEELDESLGQNLTRMMFEGPEDELVKTENTQPALMAFSLAVLRVLEEEGGVELSAAATFVAGHSLGEYSALTAAGALEFAQTARLLKARGRAMQDAVPVGEGAMAALLGLEVDRVAEIAEQAADGEVCAAANDNAPGQVVVSGDLAAVERAIALAKEAGARRGVMLPVSAPFHCALMAPAADVMADLLGEADIRPPAVPVIANVSAEAETTPDTIRRLLVEQVTARVRWRESVLYMKEHGIDQLVELGAGKVLTGLARRIDKELDAVSVGTPGDIESLLKEL